MGDHRRTGEENFWGWGAVELRPDKPKYELITNKYENTTIIPTHKLQSFALSGSASY